MSALFADTNYFVALLRERDGLHDKAVAISSQLNHRRIVTTDFVLLELLKLLGKYGQLYRDAAVETVKKLHLDPNCEVIPASRELFSLREPAKSMLREGTKTGMPWIALHTSS